MIQTPDVNLSPGMRQPNGVTTQGLNRALDLHVSTITSVAAGSADADARLKT